MEYFQEVYFKMVKNVHILIFKFKKKIKIIGRLKVVYLLRDKKQLT